MKKLLLASLVLLLSTTCFASKDYYTAEKSEFGEMFISSCASENNAKTGIDQIHFESFCRCVWRDLALNFTNEELKKIDASQEPYYTEFLKKSEQYANPCVKKYIKR